MSYGQLWRSFEKDRIQVRTIFDYRSSHMLHLAKPQRQVRVLYYWLLLPTGLLHFHFLDSELCCL